MYVDPNPARYLSQKLDEWWKEGTIAETRCDKPNPTMVDVWEIHATIPLHIEQLRRMLAMAFGKETSEQQNMDMFLLLENFFLAHGGDPTHVIEHWLLDALQKHRLPLSLIARGALTETLGERPNYHAVERALKDLIDEVERNFPGDDWSEYVVKLLNQCLELVVSEDGSVESLREKVFTAANVASDGLGDADSEKASRVRTGFHRVAALLFVGGGQVGVQVVATGVTRLLGM